MSNVKLIQLQSGQWLVGDVEVGDDGTVTIDQPLEVALEPVQTSKGIGPQIGMFPYALFAAERKFSFESSKVQVGPIEPDERCANHWRTVMSGLVTASASDMPPEPTQTKSGLLLQG